MHEALLLVDFQYDFLASSGRMPVGEENARRVIDIANSMAALFEKRGCPIVFIHNQFKASDVIRNFFRRHAAIEGSAGSRPDSRVQVRGARFVEKSRRSAFSNPDLAAYLKMAGIDHVILCGVYAEGCVLATALDAQKSGLQVTVLSDGIASDREFKYNWALSRLRRQRIRLLTHDAYREQSPGNPQESSTAEHASSRRQPASR
jgi:nicotinamidase-related amidase